jgi:hypothetical protein
VPPQWRTEPSLLGRRSGHLYSSVVEHDALKLTELDDTASAVAPHERQANNAH